MVHISGYLQTVQKAMFFLQIRTVVLNMHVDLRGLGRPSSSSGLCPFGISGNAVGVQPYP